MSLRALLTLGPFFFAIALAGFYVWPSWNRIQNLRAEIPSFEKKILQLQDENAKILGFAQRFQDIAASDREKVFFSIPTAIDLPGLLVQFENIAERNGLVLNSINTTPLPAQEGSNVQRAGVHLNLKGKRDSFLPFLSDIEKNLRIMDVNIFSFRLPTEEEETSGEGSAFDVQLVTYFLP